MALFSKPKRKFRLKFHGGLMKRFVSVLALVLYGTGVTFAQTRQAGTPAPTITAQKASQPKFKAIFEPVNYKQDLTLLDVVFVSKDEGWVSGAAGTILHTKDGGNSWTAELGGDPQAQGEQLKHLFFTNVKHGWAQAATTMFRSTDGENWQRVNGDIRGDAFFVSDVKGFRTDGGRMYATQNGGTSWKQVFTCHAKMEVEGLTQEKNCDVWVLQFPSANVGYAMGDKRIVEKTQDGGATWNVLVGPEEPDDQRVWAAFFLDENTGYAARSGTNLYRTTDGGQTWQGVVAKLPGGIDTQLKFTDHEVGWSCMGSTLAYTVDGGKHWTSREVLFPAPVVAFSLPARDRGYVVGDHGMIYRYRVVPIDYTAKGMLDAPMMPDSATHTPPQ
jgi:photosystem II stability/assembly factor-like uncharacterized protein